jgi:hypothetical protein
MTNGYSGTPLLKKLGIKNGQRLCLVHAPPDYGLLSELSAEVTWLAWATAADCDFIQAFYTEQSVLRAEFPQLKAALKKDGMLWISWIKKAARIPTDIDENRVREVALAAGLVDVKVAAIDAVWSGLKLVYRRIDR